jgi:DNA-binding NarL/FixJ family response regulator
MRATRRKRNGRVTVRRHRPGQARAHFLTPRQKEILRLVALGLTNREISHQLDISARTVEVHRYHLMRRLEVHNVAQLIRGALQHRLLSKRGLGLAS